MVKKTFLVILIGLVSSTGTNAMIKECPLAAYILTMDEGVTITINGIGYTGPLISQSAEVTSLAKEIEIAFHGEDLTFNLNKIFSPEELTSGLEIIVSGSELEESLIIFKSLSTGKVIRFRS